jgi:hypothetical protein
VRATLAAVLAAGLLACGPGTGQWRATPRGTPTSARLEDVPVCGHRVEVKCALPYGDVGGELLAADDQRLVILGREGVVEVPRTKASAVVVDVLPRRTGVAVVFVVLGTVSTVSHGLFLPLTASAWLIGGPLSVGATIREERWQFFPDSEALRDYARFPQGLPEGWPRDGAQPSPCPSDGEPPRTEPLPIDAGDMTTRPRDAVW